MTSYTQAVWGIALLAVVRFLNAAKPSEPHIVPFLLEEKGFTSQQILQDIFPIVTYSNLLATALLPFAVNPKILGVKGCSIVAALARIATRLLLIYGTSVASVQISEACFGVVLAGEIALDACVVQIAPESLCMRAVALSSTAAHLGYLLAAEGGALALKAGASYDSLFWMSLATIMMASSLTLVLPAPLKSSEVDAQVHTAAPHPQNEVGVHPAGTPSTAHHFSTPIHNVTSPRSDQGRAASGRSRQNSESERKQLLPGSAPLDTVVTSTAGFNSLVLALSVDTPSPSPGSRSNQHHTVFTTHTYTADEHTYTTDAPQQHGAHGANAQLSENPVGPTGTELSVRTPRCGDRSAKCNMNSRRFSTSNSSTAEYTPLVQQQQQQQSSDTLPLCQTHSSHVNGWSQVEVVGKHLAHGERFSWMHGGTVSRVLGKVGGNRHLLFLSLWWVAVSGPVMVFTESFCSNLFAEIDDAVEHNGHVEALAALSRILGAALAPAVQPLAIGQPATVHISWLLASACCILSLACSASLLQAYTWYIAGMGMMQLQLCLVQAQAALLVSRVDAAALFGTLTLGSITLQSVFQVLLQASGWAAQTQFLVVGLWAVLVSACCAVWWFPSRPAHTQG